MILFYFFVCYAVGTQNGSLFGREWARTCVINKNVSQARHGKKHPSLIVLKNYS